MHPVQVGSVEKKTAPPPHLDGLEASLPEKEGGVQRLLEIQLTPIRKQFILCFGGIYVEDIVAKYHWQKPDSLSEGLAHTWQETY